MSASTTPISVSPIPSTAPAPVSLTPSTDPRPDNSFSHDDEDDASSTTSYESAYLTLDLTPPNPSALQTGPSTNPHYNISHHTSHPKPPALPPTRGRHTHSHPHDFTSSATLPPNAMSRMQILDLESDSPVVSWRNQVWVGRWGRVIGSEVFVGARETEDGADGQQNNDGERRLIRRKGGGFYNSMKETSKAADFLGRGGIGIHAYRGDQHNPNPIHGDILGRPPKSTPSNPSPANDPAADPTSTNEISQGEADEKEKEEGKEEGREEGRVLKVNPAGWRVLFTPAVVKPPEYTMKQQLESRRAFMERLKELKRRKGEEVYEAEGSGDSEDEEEGDGEEERRRDGEDEDGEGEEGVEGVGYFSTGWGEGGQ